MAVTGIHYLSLGDAQAKYERLSVEFKQAKQRLDEAVAEGDLRENSGYDSAKSTVSRLANELNELRPVMSMKGIRANDTVNFIQEGCVIDLIIHQLTKDPIKVGSAEFESLKQKTPAFRGIIAYGASLKFQELLIDKIISVDSPIGMFLDGKQPGDYSVKVPGGFSNITVSKIYNVESVDELYCSLGGVKYEEEKTDFRE